MGVNHFIHPDAKIDQGVQVGHFSVIEADVQIGEGTFIDHNVTILSGARIGKNCRIFPGAVIAAIPQDLKFNDEYSTVEIGDNTTIRECVTVNRGTIDRQKTTIGNNCLLMAYVHVAHDVIIGDNCIIANLASIAGHVVIEDHVVIEGVVGIQQFARIGRFAFVSGGSKVRKNIPPFVKVARDPLAYAGVNSIGLKRNGYESDKVKAIEDIYRILYVQNSNLSKGIEEVKKNLSENPYIQEILEFIETSDNGVIKGMI
jgi:UDP-N-acetylglucosamine acyltransferase